MAQSGRPPALAHRCRLSDEAKGVRAKGVSSRIVNNTPKVLSSLSFADLKYDNINTSSFLTQGLLVE